MCMNQCDYPSDDGPCRCEMDARKEYDNSIAALTKGITGASLEKANLLLAAHGWSLRVMRTEKGNCLGTCDFVANRFNVSVENESVVEVLSVG